MQQLELRSSNELEEWLQDKSGDWVQAIAVRAALRVFPFVLNIRSVPEKVIQRDFKERLILQAFRATFLSWAARHYPAQDTSAAVAAAAAATNAANEASKATYAAAAGAAAAAVVYAADATNAANEASKATDAEAVFFATSTAVYAAAAAATEAAATYAATTNYAEAAAIWQAVSADARWLTASGRGAHLIDQPLWLTDDANSSTEGQPQWDRDVLSDFEKSDWVQSGPWGVILDWYRTDILNGIKGQSRSYFGERADIEIATQPEGFWTIVPGRSAEVILGDIGILWEGGSTNFERWKEVEAPKPKTPESDASVETQFDHPTADDDLGRRPFAQALVKRLDEMLKKGGKDGLAVNLHAPWGAGKTSVLLMMEEALTGLDREAGPWGVVHFNAWDHENRKPPWWPLIEAVNGCCQKSLRSVGRDVDANWLRLNWIWWRTLSNVVPIVLCLSVFGLLMFWLMSNGQGTEGDTAKGLSLDAVLKTLLSAAGALAAFVAAGRALVFGSADNAKFYFTLARDPLKRVRQLFNDIINQTGMPVCIFIDDLDRCNVDFVVDLLEGIQTSFRHEKVAYVVAADKTWIRSSFESRYETFDSHIGDAGQPLGYLFLEKIFQFSVPVPGMGAWKKRYFDKLLKGAEEDEGAQVQGASESGPEAAVDPAEKTRIFDEQVAQKRSDIQDRRGRNISREAMRTELEEVSDDAITRAALVLEYADSDLAQKETEHLLARFVDQLPENPRVMKRLINAFGMRLSNDLLEETNAPDEVIARWTILEQRFPALADLLVSRPDWAEHLASPDESEVVPDNFKPFWKSEPVQNILIGPIRAADGRDQKVEAPALDAKHVRLITRGASD